MGKVYIVGAGPGKIELLTLKAYEIIMRADVILYDDLIGEIHELLKRTKAKLIYVGKRGGRHKIDQREINELLVKLSKEYNIVVRLKGGDPFVFGRGGEEAEHLMKNGVEFEVVSGITSAIAVPAAVGIPVTHRRYDPAFVVMTGRESRERLNWKALAELKATIVILMGVSRIKEICSKLIENGKDPETPAAVIEKGFTKEQRVFRCKLKDLADLCEKEKVEPPAVIVIGGVAELSLCT